MPHGISATARARLAGGLRYFRFYPSPGGHGDVPETLCAEIAYCGLDELLSLFERMGRPLCWLPGDAPREIAGKSYTCEQWTSLRHPISAWPQLEEPGHGPLLNVECSVSIGADRICIYLSGGKDRDFWSVTETDYRNAKDVEKTMLELGIFPVALEPVTRPAVG